MDQRQRQQALGLLIRGVERKGAFAEASKLLYLGREQGRVFNR